VRKGIAAGGSPAEQLRRVVHDFADDHAERHTESRIVNYELAALTPEHLAEIRAIRFRELVEAGVASGDFDTPNPRMTAVALLSLGIDLARWYREDGTWRPEDIADRYADMALRIVGARHL
jgi:hypothetical protein